MARPLLWRGLEAAFPEGLDRAPGRLGEKGRGRDPLAPRDDRAREAELAPSILPQGGDLQREGSPRQGERAVEAAVAGLGPVRKGEGDLGRRPVAGEGHRVDARLGGDGEDALARRDPEQVAAKPDEISLQANALRRLLEPPHEPVRQGIAHRGGHGH